MLQMNAFIRKHPWLATATLSAWMGSWVGVSVYSPRVAITLLEISLHGFAASGTLYIAYKSAGLVKYGLEHFKNQENRMATATLTVLSVANIGAACYLLNHQMQYLNNRVFG